MVLFLTIVSDDTVCVEMRTIRTPQGVLLVDALTQK
jgi:hypothetical protein